MKQIPLNHIAQRAVIRPSGYIADVLSHATVVGCVARIEDGDFVALREKWKSAEGASLSRSSAEYMSFRDSYPDCSIPVAISDGKHEPPGVFQQAKSFVGAVGAELRAIASGKEKVSEQKVMERLSICEACEFFGIGGKPRCQKCGCFVRAKAKFRTSSCPMKKW
jgi:hypothetical protein